MKKVCAILCAVGILILSACSAPAYDEAAVQTYVDTANHMRELTNTSIDAKILVYSDVERKNLNTKITLQGDMMLQEQDFQAKMDATLSASGLSIGNICLYFKDQMMYGNILGNKTKVSMEKELASFYENLEQSNVEITETTVKEIAKEMKYEDEEQGIIYVAFDSDKVMDPNDITKDDVAFDKIERFDATFQSEDQMWKEIIFHIDAKSEETIVAIDIIIELSHINQIEQIDFPDFSDYIENDISVNIGNETLNSEKSQNNYEAYEETL